MFQFPAYPPSSAWRRAFNPPGSPIRTSPDQFLFADPRGLSQLTTSFFGSGSLGILRSLFFSFSSQMNIAYTFEIAVPFQLSRKNSIKIKNQTNLLFFTSCVFQYYQRSVPIVIPKGAAKIHTFSIPANLFLIFLKIFHNENDRTSQPGRISTNENF